MNDGKKEFKKRNVIRLFISHSHKSIDDNNNKHNKITLLFTEQRSSVKSDLFTQQQKHLYDL